MANLKILSCGVAAFSLFAISASAATPYAQNVNLVKIPQYGDCYSEPEYPEEPEHGNRLPQKRIQCLIDPETGIEFLSTETPMLVSYELYDTEGNLINSFSCEDDFIENLFSLSGEYRILLNDTNSSYTGFISL